VARIWRCQRQDGSSSLPPRTKKAKLMGRIAKVVKAMVCKTINREFEPHFALQVYG
jgi:hypothetical protein